MPKADARANFLSKYSLVRYQLTLAVLAVCVRLAFWLLHLPSNTLGTFIYTFVCGNVSMALIIAGLPLFARRQPPWKWIGFATLLVCTSILANLAAELPIYLIFTFERSFLHGLLEDAPFGILMTVIVGALAFGVDQSREQLLAQNRQLQSQVHLGLVEKRAHVSELEQAGEIQMHLLPRETPQLPGFEIACAWQPANSVSGDYFDVFPVGKGQLAVCIADVSGKGMAAALLMANLQASVKAFANDNPSPGAMCARLNTALSNNIAPGRFVTLFYGVLDANSRSMRYENAGHCLPLLVHADGSVDFPAAYSGVLGMFSHWTYSDREQQLRAGDTLLLLTDGVLEAADAKEEEFGYQRLIRSVIESRQRGVHGIREQVLEDVNAFCGGHFQDDASLIVVSVQ
jgi:sigma-B regulation protein RsbU (phosphoserine phosphatase)